MLSVVGVFLQLCLGVGDVGSVWIQYQMVVGVVDDGLCVCCYIEYCWVGGYDGWDVQCVCQDGCV